MKGSVNPCNFSVCEHSFRGRLVDQTGWCRSGQGQCKSLLAANLTVKTNRLRPVFPGLWQTLCGIGLEPLTYLEQIRG